MRTTLFILITTLFLSCSNKNNNPEITNENIKIVNQLFEHFNNHDWQKMANLYVEVGEFKDPSLGPGIVKMSRTEIVEKYSQLHQVFPDIKDEVVSIYPSGDKHIIVEFISTGTALDDTTFELPICTIFTIENGKITKDYNYFDDFEE